MGPAKPHAPPPVSFTTCRAASTDTVPTPYTPNCAGSTVKGVCVRSTLAYPHAAAGDTQHAAVAKGTAPPAALSPQLVTFVAAVAPTVTPPQASNRSKPDADVAPSRTTRTAL